MTENIGGSLGDEIVEVEVTSFKHESLEKQTSELVKAIGALENSRRNGALLEGQLEEQKANIKTGILTLPMDDRYVQDLVNIYNTKYPDMAIETPAQV